MSIAIVTGASSGLGRAFARRLSRDPDIREIWAIARREDRLKELGALCACPVRSIPLDLREDSSFQTLRDLLSQENPVISVLVCAAGFGKMGNAAAVDPSDNAAMIDVNCKAAMAVTLLCRPWLRRGSRVIEISSVSAFTPVPGVGVYAATKAFLESFSKTLRQEWKRDGIHVTAVCPYWIKDTEFIEKAEGGLPGSWNSFPLAITTKTVVEQALRDSRRNRAVSAPGAVASAAKVGTKLLPDNWIAALLDRMRGI